MATKNPDTDDANGRTDTEYQETPAGRQLPIEPGDPDVPRIHASRDRSGMYLNEVGVEDAWIVASMDSPNVALRSDDDEEHDVPDLREHVDRWTGGR